MRVMVALLVFVCRTRALTQLRRGTSEVTRTLVKAFASKPITDSEYDYHVPVLRDECLHYLQVKPGGIYVDCTLGGGGHTRTILAAGGSVIGFDQDPDAVAKASAVCRDYITAGKLEIFQTNFRWFSETVLTRSSLVAARGGGGVDGILMDLGVSSHQINEPSRGFAFGADGPLDMRMSKGQTPEVPSTLTAATIINEYDSDTLANILYDFGEETRSRQIAREIVSARPLATTLELEKVISRTTSWAQRPKVLARCFQALRIAVNDELGALDEALSSAHRCLRPRGRLVVISYHSLEDRRVKRLMRTGSVTMGTSSSNVDVTGIGGGDVVRGFSGVLSSAELRMSRYLNTRGEGTYDALVSGSLGGSPWLPLFKRAQAPSEEEITRNRRARSAKLRVAERAQAPGDGVDEELETASAAALVTGAAVGSTEIDASKKYPVVGKKQLLKQKRLQEAEDFYE